MRVLIVGAGAVGGYFGGRLAEVGRDVSFLVRPRRAAELAASGLVVTSRFGDIRITAPKTVLAEHLTHTFDLILLSCKAYDFEDAMTSFAPAVGAETAILPLLNGLRHLDALKARFGAGKVLGGQCFIAATLDEHRNISHLSKQHGLTYGELDGSRTPRIRAIEELVTGVRFEPYSSDAIVLEMWEKWVFLATLAGGTCLMRATIGDIAATPGGIEFMRSLFAECCAVATTEGNAPRPAPLERALSTLTAAGSPLNASMLRDIENGFPVEADHIIGDLLERAARHGTPCVRLQIVQTHLKAYEARRMRTGNSAGQPGG